MFKRLKTAWWSVKILWGIATRWSQTKELGEQIERCEYCGSGVFDNCELHQFKLDSLAIHKDMDMFMDSMEEISRCSSCGYFRLPGHDCLRCVNEEVEESQ